MKLWNKMEILNTVEQKTTLYKIVISVVFGLIGFFLNFQTIIFPFGEYTSAILLGLLFPLIITLSWGWRYGLLSALAGGCQSMWWLWGAYNGYAIFLVVPPFTLWIVWHGIFAELRKKQSSDKWWLSAYVVEVPFRLLSSINLLTLSRWAVSFNPPPWNWAANASATTTMEFSVFVVFKQAFVGLMLLLIADVLLHLDPVRTFFKLRKSQNAKKTGYIISASLLFGCLYWIIDSIFHVFVFHKNSSFIELLAKDIPRQNLFTRIVVFLLCLLFGMYSAKILRKQKEDEAALMDSEEKYRKLFELANDAIFMADDESGIILDANKKASQLSGYSKEELIGKHQSFLHSKSEQDKISERFKAVGELKGDTITETCIVNKDGSTIPVEINSGKKAILSGIKIRIGIFRDISERTQAEEKIRAAEENLKNTFDISPSIIAKVNILTGYFVEVSPAVERILGYSVEAITTQPVIEFIHPDDRQKTIDQISKPPKGKYTTLLENRFLCKDGSYTWLAWHTTKADEEGFVTAIGSDINLRKLAEKGVFEKSLELKNQLKKSEKQRIANIVILKDLNKITKILKSEVIERKKAEDQVKNDLQEKNTLLQELYHRTKNNMQVISSMLRMESRRSESELVKKSFKEITSKISTMALVHQKLYQAKDLSRINLDEYVRDLVELIIQGYSRESARVKFNYKMEEIYVLIDTVMPLGLVLNELLTNAFKHAFPDNKEGEIFITLKLDSQGLINLAISDNGIGIPENMDLRQSQSMGLQTMFALVEHQLQGSVEYENSNGLTWHIKLKPSLNSQRV